jgi:hypothetical protein
MGRAIVQAPGRDMALDRSRRPYLINPCIPAGTYKQREKLINEKTRSHDTVPVSGKEL